MSPSDDAAPRAALTARLSPSRCRWLLPALSFAFVLSAQLSVALGESSLDVAEALTRPESTAAAILFELRLPHQTHSTLHLWLKQRNRILRYLRLNRLLRRE